MPKNSNDGAKHNPIKKNPMTGAPGRARPAAQSKPARDTSSLRNWTDEEIYSGLDRQDAARADSIAVGSGGRARAMRRRVAAADSALALNVENNRRLVAQRAKTLGGVVPNPYGGAAEAISRSMKKNK